MSHGVLLKELRVVLSDATPDFNLRVSGNKRRLVKTRVNVITKGHHLLSRLRLERLQRNVVLISDQKVIVLQCKLMLPADDYPVNIDRSHQASRERHLTVGIPAKRDEG